jgi:histone-lysine N-methyltransferase SETD1
LGEIELRPQEGVMSPERNIKQEFVYNISVDERSLEGILLYSHGKWSYCHKRHGLKRKKRTGLNLDHCYRKRNCGIQNYSKDPVEETVEDMTEGKMDQPPLDRDCNSYSKEEGANESKHQIFGGAPASPVSEDPPPNLTPSKARSGHRCKVEVRNSKIHGSGLFAGEFIRAGEVIGEYMGEIIGKAVSNMREKMYIKNGIDSVYLFGVNEDTIIDATVYGNDMRFANHSCEPNSIAKSCYRKNNPKVYIHAMKDLNVGDEITFDYAFSSEDGFDRIECKCGSKKCRKYIEI